MSVCSLGLQKTQLAKLKSICYRSMQFTVHYYHGAMNKLAAGKVSIFDHLFHIRTFFSLKVSHIVTDNSLSLYT